MRWWSHSSPSAGRDCTPRARDRAAAGREKRIRASWYPPEWLCFVTDDASWPGPWNGVQRSITGHGVDGQVGDVHPAHVAAWLDVRGRGREREAVRADLHHRRVRAVRVDQHGAGHAHGAMWNAVVAGDHGGRERERRGLAEGERAEIEPRARVSAARAATSAASAAVGRGGRVARD